MNTPNQTNMMTSNKPYILRALYEWIIDHNMTPYIIADTSHPKNIKAPLQYAKENKIILDISPSATFQLKMQNDYITFSARFSGKSLEIIIPVGAILAIYAKETGNGMTFEPSIDTDPSPPTSSPSPPQKTHGQIKKPHLTLTKA